jgi:hypothetical protein
MSDTKTGTEATPPTPSVTGGVVAAGAVPQQSQFTTNGTDFDNWLRDFYKECGREATLAYTTLNQMKNWAITVQGAIVAAVAAFGKSITLAPGESLANALAFPFAVGGTLAYVFTLRFFVRAMLCYTNLLRWNTLQTSILQAKLLPRDARPGIAPPTDAERLDSLRQNIQNYYYRWRSPIDRLKQLSSNLKLGFGILAVIPPIMLLWSAILAWDISFVRAMAAFALGATVIEGEDFFTSPFFDRPDAKERADHEIFPAAGSDGAYIVRWAAVAVLCAIVALWPWLSVLVLGAGPLPNPR